MKNLGLNKALKPHPRSYRVTESFFNRSIPLSRRYIASLLGVDYDDESENLIRASMITNTTSGIEPSRKA